MEMEMKGFVVVMMLLPATCTAEDLGQRVMWSAVQIPAARWQTATGITVGNDGNTVTLKAGDVDYGWAATEGLLPVTDTTVVDLRVKSVVNGQFNVQVEWCRADGSFLRASPLLDRTKTEANVASKKILELAGEGERPSKFRLKFWLEGRQASAVIGNATIGFQRRWRKAETRLMKTYDAGAKTTADAGIAVETRGGVMEAKLGAGTPYAAFVLEERVATDKKGVVMIDLAGVQSGSVTVQALGWKEDGTFVASADLLKDASTAGCFEVPVALVSEKLGADAMKLSFKVWLAGGETSAQLAGIFYGVLP